ncbi:MAG: sulfurtransferase TusA family protein [Deltaproteobacteria bacterium]|nr:MAG: sulfurtransferase TusA family protein [Deltaproteobacteria bacterium]
MKADITLDCYGLLCPMPIIKITQKIKEVPVGQVLEVISTDEGIKSDLPAWCSSNGQEFLGIEQEDDTYKGYVKKIKD